MTLRVNFGKPRAEHNLSAITPTATEKADVGWCDAL